MSFAPHGGGAGGLLHFCRTHRSRCTATALGRLAASVTLTPSAEGQLLGFLKHGHGCLRPCVGKQEELVALGPQQCLGRRRAQQRHPLERMELRMVAHASPERS